MRGDVTDETLVRVTHENGADCGTLALGSFVQINSLDDDERAAIVSDLAAKGEYRGGGGAGPIWELTLLKP